VPDETSLTVAEPEGFKDLAKTVLKSMGDLSKGIHQAAADVIVAAVREAYMTGYNDGYRDALRRIYLPAEGSGS
jgi:hypothetical protein